MLTFYYDDWRVHIADTGNAEYARLDPDSGIPVVTTETPARIVMLTGSILRLIATETLEAEMRVARVAQELHDATVALEDAEIAEFAAEGARNKAKAAQSELSAQLRSAEGLLQLTMAEQAGKAE